MKFLDDLLDPRLSTVSVDNDLTDLAIKVLQAKPSDQRSGFVSLANSLQETLDRGGEKKIRDAIKIPGLPGAKRLLIDALDKSVSSADTTLPLQGLFFALPVLIVTGGSSIGKISAVLPKTFDVRKLFEEVGAMAYSQNVSFSNVLTSLDRLEKVSWAYLLKCNRGDDLDEVGFGDFPPADILCHSGMEKVHLRFLIGLSIGSTRVPKFTETAGDISKWGMSFTQDFGKAISVGSGEVLAIPRRPVSFPRAIYDGLWAANEMGFQVFLSSVLRSARQTIGEPDVSIASYSDNTVRIRFTSVFDDSFDKTYGWHLSVIDEFSVVVETITDLLRECGLRDVRVSPTVVDS